MIDAFLWAFGAAASLIAGGAVALITPISPRLLGLTMAFGAGVLISAVAYDLIGEAAELSFGQGLIGLGLATGAITFYVGDGLIDRMGGANRKSIGDGDEGGSALAIVLGIVLDGIPESIVIGLTLLTGAVIDVAVVAAVFLSNIPESVAATAGLKARGWSSTKILGLWLAVALVSGLAGLVGYVIFQSTPVSWVAFVDAFAAGAIITMLADTMVPEAFEHARGQAGLATTLGFGLAFALSAAT